MKFVPPKKMKLIGSWGIGTGTRDCSNINLAVEIPSGCFKPKDISHGRLLSKRTIYLRAIAQNLH